jgi:hypothetical protein
MIGLLTGYPIMPSKFGGSAAAAAFNQIEEILSVLNLVGSPTQRGPQRHPREQ